MLDCFINAHTLTANGTVAHRQFYCQVESATKFWVFQLSDDDRRPSLILNNDDGFYRRGRWQLKAGGDAEMAMRTIIESCTRQYWVEGATYSFLLKVDHAVPLDQPFLVFVDLKLPPVIAEAVIHRGRIGWKTLGRSGKPLATTPKFFMSLPKAHFEQTQATR